MTQFEKIETNGITLNVALAGDGPLVILVHGFPESWYSWRHQIEALSAAGYRVAAPDVRGYGASDKPHAIDAYAMREMTADMAGLAHALSPDAPAVIVGHDWGAPIAWNSARLYPDTFRAVAGLSVPYTPPGDIVALNLYKKLFTDKGRFFYQVYFQDEGVAEAELEANPEDSIAKFLWAWSGDAHPDGWPTDKAHGDQVLTGIDRPELPLAWLTEADLAVYAEQFAQSGFRGPLNRYRNWHRDHDFLKSHPSDPIIQQPGLFIGGEYDPVLTMFARPPSDLLPAVLARPQGIHMLEGVGHWTQQEAPDRVNRLLIDWLAKLH